MYRDCFARVEGHCGVLKRMICETGECPFYKSKKQYDEDVKKYPYEKQELKKT